MLNTSPHLFLGYMVGERVMVVVVWPSEHQQDLQIEQSREWISNNTKMSV